MSFFIDNQVSPQFLNIDELYYIKPSTTFVEKGYYPSSLLGKLTSVTGEQFKRFLFSDVKEVTTTNPIQTIPWIHNGQQRTNVTFAYVDNDEDDAQTLAFKNRNLPKFWNVVKRNVTSGLPAQQLARQKGLPPHLEQYINSFLMPDKTSSTPAPPSERGGSRRRRYKKTNKRRRTNKRKRTNRRR